MQIQLSNHFTYKTLLRFTFPSIVMMIFTSIYGVVDGLFVSNFVGKTSFAAVNFIMPVLMIMGTVGTMFGTGGSALIAKTLGEGDREKASRLFSLFVYLCAVLGMVLAVIGIIFMREIAVFLGAEGQMLEDCVTYGRLILIVLPAYTLQYAFQSFFITAEKPQLGLGITVAAGMTHMTFVAVLVAVLKLGLVGAAISSAMGQLVGGIVPVIYFARKNPTALRLGRSKFDGKAILKACTNGSSELMSSISMSVVSMLYNFQLMKYAGEDGVAAYGVMMYVSMIFMAVFMGYSIGSGPVVGYHYGAENHGELRSLLKKSIVLICVFSVVMFGLSLALARPLSAIFVGYDEGLLEITVRGFIFFSFSFLFAGFAIYGSSFFTALNNGLVSALISFLRTMLFQIAAILLFPLIWGLDGIWLSIVGAEVMAVVVTVAFLVGMRKKYHY